ncbi:twin-arginine translocase TatA/TatE family subunit [Tepidicaulis sp.]|uniref:twin-arginine translocase TatA/TatE family subunit n=1 Tax=Tepidicaulis sp. TaxID=1920809 RepID=UPI003B5BC885
MGQIGPWQIIIVVVLVVLLFGRGKISALMGDVAKGIRSFRKGLTEEEADEQGGAKSLENKQEQPAAERAADAEKDSKVNS